jgi:hypothetical protein
VLGLVFALLGYISFKRKDLLWKCFIYLYF